MRPTRKVVYLVVAKICRELQYHGHVVCRGDHGLQIWFWDCLGYDSINRSDLKPLFLAF